MDELLDILDASGNYTGQRILKSKAHVKGVFHPTVHIWFHTRAGDVLIQQRSGNKDTHPLLWDVSVAGHVGAGEDLILSALREIKEEIGLTVGAGDLQKTGVFKSMQQHGNGLMDNEFHHTYMATLTVGLDALVKQESEVRDLALIPLSHFMDELLHPEYSKKYVPHGLAYYRAIAKAVSERL
ncbi:MAG: NUDIX domain-containing protein [Sediminicola sp.]